MMKPGTWHRTERGAPVATTDSYGPIVRTKLPSSDDPALRKRGAAVVELRHRATPFVCPDCDQPILENEPFRIVFFKWSGRRIRTHENCPRKFFVRKPSLKKLSKLLAQKNQRKPIQHKRNDEPSVTEVMLTCPGCGWSKPKRERGAYQLMQFSSLVRDAQMIKAHTQRFPPRERPPRRVRPEPALRESRRPAEGDQDRGADQTLNVRLEQSDSRDPFAH
jgi:predicted RNA-binding Zn-ribbon protein involved in translation (DUF1610 family)